MSDEPRQLNESRKNRITWHINDLLRRDINVAYECTQWLAPKQRDIDRRARPKRHAARYIAACMVVEGSENPAFAREVLDRTEGKVADVLITGSFGELVKALEAGRERLALERAPQDMVVEGEVVAAEEPHVEPTSTDSDRSK